MNRFAVLKQAVKPLYAPFPIRLAFSERRLLLRVGDLVLVLASIIGSLLVWLRLGARALDWSIVRGQSLWMLLIFFGWSVWLSLSDLYNLRLAVKRGSIVRRVSVGGLLLVALYLVLFFVTSRTFAFLPSGFLGVRAEVPPLRLAPVLAILASTGLLVLWRFSYAWLLGGPHARRRLVILGAGRAGTTLCGVILKGHCAHYDVVGFLDDDPAKQGQSVGDVPILGGHQRLVQLAESQVIDEVAIAISTEVQGSLFQVVMDCHERGVTITPMPLLFERLTGRVAVEHIGSQWYVALPLQQPAASIAWRVVKRLFDLVLGLCLGVVFVLVLPLVALAIWIDTPGPIFYRQERVGQHGRPFSVYKFRSMTKDAERNGEAQWAVKNDSRITRVGRFLRQVRLDELPQALNVIRGEMSLVGPRPERQPWIEQLQRQIPFYRTRLAAKPGLTGWAQINYGYCNTVEDALVKLQYDLYYLKHQSLWFDVLILLRTVVVVLKMGGV